MPTNEHGHEIDPDWVPGSPVLRGEERTPDELSVPIPAPGQTIQVPLDELPHRVRRDMGLNNDQPDPGYDPDGDDVA